MKQLLLIALLITGCHLVNTEPVKVPTPEESVQSKPEEIVVGPIKVTGPAQTLQLPIKFTVDPNLPVAYSNYAERTRKFLQLLVTDKSILENKAFTMNTMTAAQIRQKISVGFDVKVRSFNPGKIALATSYRKTIAEHDDWVIKLVYTRLNRPECQIINTLAHESMHAYGFSHEGNSSVGKENTVPYWVGNKAEELCKEGKI